MNKLKHVIVVLFLMVTTVNLFAQTEENKPEKTTEKKTEITKGNIIKINLSALVVKNISIQYERQVSKKTSFALNVHMLPFGTLPFKSSIEKAINDPSVDINKLKLGIFGITPEYRFYLGKKALHGFYFGLFGSYNNFKTEFPINYDVNSTTRTGVFEGKLSTYTFGLQLGAQWNLSKTVYLDWWILGPNYGSAKGDLILATALSQDEQTSLSDELSKLKADAPLSVIKSYSVSSTGATIKAQGPWAGLRGLGINLGIRF